MSPIQTLKPDTEYILEAVLFTHPRNAEKAFNKIQWTLTPDGGSPESIGTGNAICYKFDKKHAGKKSHISCFHKKRQ